MNLLIKYIYTIILGYLIWKFRSLLLSVWILIVENLSYKSIAAHETKYLKSFFIVELVIVWIGYLTLKIIWK